MAFLFGWVFVAEIWESERGLSEVQKDDWEKRCQESISQYLDRWILCSQWAGVWATSSSTTIESYLRKFAELLKSMRQCSGLQEAHRAWDECFKGFVDGLVDEATKYVNDISAASRERVRIYQTILWLWHRLDKKRWSVSQIPLRVKKRKVRTEVDHIVAFSLWKQRLESAKLAGAPDGEETEAIVNKLGNCALLEKNFNISKSDKALAEFLPLIHEFNVGATSVERWCIALDIPSALVDPTHADIRQITSGINKRDQNIRADVIEFIRGERTRVDIGSPVQSGQQNILIDESDAVRDDDEYAIPKQAWKINDTVSPTPDTQPGELDADTNETSSALDLEHLRSAYQVDSQLRLVVDNFAGRERNQKITEVDVLVGALHRAKTPLGKYDVVRVLRLLDSVGIGRFITGRRGKPTRFEWSTASSGVRALATEAQNE